MIHLVGEYLGTERVQQGTAHVYHTLCKQKFGMMQKLPLHGPVNLGARDGDRCPECLQHKQALQSHLTDDFAQHQGQGLLGVSPAIHDQGVPEDRGRPITKVSGYGDHLLATEEGGYEGGDLGGYVEGYSQEDGGHVGGAEEDPYGEGPVQQQRGAQAAANGQPRNSCPFKRPGYFQDMWLMGYDKQLSRQRLTGR